MVKFIDLIFKYRIPQLIFLIGTIIVLVSQFMPWKTLQDMSHTGYWQDERIYYGYELYSIYLTIISLIVCVILMKFYYYPLYFFLIIMYLLISFYAYYFFDYFGGWIPEQRLILHEGIYIAQLGSLIQIISLYIGFRCSIINRKMETIAKKKEDIDLQALNIELEVEHKFRIKYETLMLCVFIYPWGKLLFDYVLKSPGYMIFLAIVIAISILGLIPLMVIRKSHNRVYYLLFILFFEIGLSMFRPMLLM